MNTPVGKSSAGPTAESILDRALQIAERKSWEHLHLHEIADSMGITLEQIRRHYPQKDDLVEAWFDRADAAVLSRSIDSAAGNRHPAARCEEVMMCWFDALSAHRRVTRQMLAYKLEPGHLHLQIPAIMRISRTVQWFREAARLNASGPRRIVEETLLSAAYLCTFSCWLFDDSPGSDKARRLLRGQLRKIPGLYDARY